MNPRARHVLVVLAAWASIAIENAKAFDKDGFFKTGDVAKISENGYVSITGRIKEMINRGGESISATVIEGLIDRHPDVVAVAVIATFGFTLTALGFFLFCAALVTIIWIDLHHQIIPDVISLPGIIFGFAFSFISFFVTWQESLIGMLAGGGIFYAVSYSYYLLRRQEGLGGGDIKLLAMIGAFLGWKGVFFTIMASSLTGTVVGIAAMLRAGKGMKMALPFGPFLALGALLFLFLGTPIINWYFNML